MKTVCIIGGGIGGLATANLLAKEGYKVTVVEKNERLGGRANLFEEAGFRFDMGPSWYLMPDVFERYFDLLGKDVARELDLVQLKPNYRVYYGNEYYDITTDLDALGDLFESWEVGAKEQLKKYMDRSAYAYKVAMEEFVYKNYDSITDFFTWKMLTEGWKLSVFESMANYVHKYFRDDRIKKIMQYTLVFLGGAPSNTPAIYNIMSHVDLAQGVWYPQGGMYEVPKALVRAGEELGVQYRTQVDVAEILMDEKTGLACGIRDTQGEVFSADIVVCNGDYHYAEEVLLPKAYRQYSPRYWQKKVPAPSAFIMYLGVKKRLEGLRHHTLFFASDWEKHFEEIFSRPAWPDDPSYYIGCPSKTDSTVAPEGMENVFVLVPVASGLDDSQREEYAEKILIQMEKDLGEPIRPYLEVKRLFTVRDFESRYHSHKGSALGLAHTLFQTALFRPRNYSKKVKNLFYVGADTVPGIGVPMCLISSELVCERIRRWTSS